jgi:GAF domain-containing protein
MIDEQTQCVGGGSGSVRAELASAPDPGIFNMPRELSMCGHVVASGQTMVVDDVARDPRFANNPALQAAGIRFYAGAPFGDDQGHVFGSLCILDTRPRSLSEREVRLLATLAQELASTLRSGAAYPDPAEAKVPATQPNDDEPTSARVGQPVPG